MQMVHCLRDTTSHPWFQNEAAPDNRIRFRLVASQTQRLRSPPLPLPPSIIGIVLDSLLFGGPVWQNCSSHV